MWTVLAEHGNFKKIIKRFNNENDAIIFCEDFGWQYRIYGLITRLAIRFYE